MGLRPRAARSTRGDGQSMRHRFPLLLTLVLGIAPAASAQQNQLDPFGTETFRAILKLTGLTPLTAVDHLAGDPQRNILIVLGDTRPLDQMLEPGQLASLIQEGLAV